MPYTTKSAPSWELSLHPLNIVVNITNDKNNNWTITNTHTPEKLTISGTKTWDDADNQDGKRPESIKINLIADGGETPVKTLTVTKDENWSWSFSNLPKYKDGKEIKYTIKSSGGTVYNKVGYIEGVKTLIERRFAETQSKFGKEYYGARNWIIVGGLSMQLSELSKEDIPDAIKQIMDAKILHDTVCKVEEMEQTVKDYLEALKKQNLKITGNIYVTDIVNCLITSNPDNYCTLIYAKSEKEYIIFKNRSIEVKMKKPLQENEDKHFVCKILDYNSQDGLKIFRYMDKQEYLIKLEDIASANLYDDKIEE